MPKIFLWGDRGSVNEENNFTSFPDYQLYGHRGWGGFEFQKLNDGYRFEGLIWLNHKYDWWFKTDFISMVNHWDEEKRRLIVGGWSKNNQFEVDGVNYLRMWFVGLEMVKLKMKGTCDEERNTC